MAAHPSLELPVAASSSISPFVYFVVTNIWGELTFGLGAFEIRKTHVRFLVLSRYAIPKRDHSLFPSSLFAVVGQCSDMGTSQRSVPTNPVG